MNNKYFLLPNIPIVDATKLPDDILEALYKFDKDCELYDYYPFYLHGDSKNEHEEKIIRFFRCSVILSDKILITNC
jgi:hypothetical protein